jgi:type IV fimbrial biogenesis protein FimT
MTTATIPKGFTLIELLVTIGIVGILLGIAVPSFQDFFRNSRLASQSNDLLASLNLARSEAVRRGVRVTVCKSADPSATTPACSTSGNWSQGWIVFADIEDGQNGRPGATGTIDTNDLVIRVFSSLSVSTLNGDSKVSNWISYLPNGAIRGNGSVSGETSSGTFTLCNAPTSRVITLNPAGRASATPGTC